MAKRVFLIVLDSFGIGGALDADKFGDYGSNTLAAVQKSASLSIPCLGRMGLYNIDGVRGEGERAPLGAFGRLRQTSLGKDTTIGHWEIAGLETPKPLPTFPNGFPDELLRAFTARTGRGVLCNRPYSGTQVIRDFGAQHMATGALIVYTSADSVFQVAAHEAVVPLPQLYGYCEAARELLTGEYAVGRVIARPFVGGGPGDFARTAGRHDYSLAPAGDTVLDAIRRSGRSVISVGKIYDIFAGRGITEQIVSKDNEAGMRETVKLARRDFEGIAFINLVDFDMLYGHRNDTDGYARALSFFDRRLCELLPLLRGDDLLMITADHGCDPSTPSTDHSREDVPLLCCGGPAARGVNLGTQRSFGCIANTVAEYFGLPAAYCGHSLLPLLRGGA